MIAKRFASIRVQQELSPPPARVIRIPARAVHDSVPSKPPGRLRNNQDVAVRDLYKSPGYAAKKQFSECRLALLANHNQISRYGVLLNGYLKGRIAMSCKKHDAIPARVE